jgi:hypothetical protein
MVDRIVRQESWINEVEFDYSQLYAKPSLVLKSLMPILM